MFAQTSGLWLPWATVTNGSAYLGDPESRCAGGYNLQGNISSTYDELERRGAHYTFQAGVWQPLDPISCPPETTGDRFNLHLPLIFRE
ncbi:MAG: hypothetical protein HC837_11965 [Chloroflexaceae bacterium]|nr:hypothetical protein [Chloroflexaceae bacterium]